MSPVSLHLEFLFKTETERQKFLQFLLDDNVNVLNYDQCFIYKKPEWRCVFYAHILDSVAYRLHYDNFFNVKKIETVTNTSEDIIEFPLIKRKFEM